MNSCDESPTSFVPRTFAKPKTQITTSATSQRTSGDDPSPSWSGKKYAAYATNSTGYTARSTQATTQFHQPSRNPANGPIPVLTQW